MSPDARKVSALGVFPSLEPGDRVMVLRPGAPDPANRVGTMEAEELAPPATFIATTLAEAQDNLQSGLELTVGARYDIAGNWNGAGTTSTVYVQALGTDAFSPVGVLRDAAGTYTAVKVDVAAGTTSLQVDLSAYATKLDLTTKQGAVVRSTNVNLNSNVYEMPRALLGQRVLFFPVGATAIALPEVTLLDVGTVVAVTRGGGPGGGGTLTFTDARSDSFTLDSVGHTKFVEVVSLDRGTPFRDTVASWVVLAEVGASGKLYDAPGPQTDGALTVKATTDALAKKANLVLRWPSLFSEQDLAPLQNGDITTLEQYRSYNFTAAAVTISLPVAWAGTVAALIYLRATVDTALTFQTGKLDDKASAGLVAGEWRIIRGDLVDGQATGWATVLRGNLAAPFGGGGGGGGGTGTVTAVNGVAPDAAGNVALPSRDVYDVPAEKRAAIADAIINQVAGGGQPMLREQEAAFVGQVFKDNRDPANSYRYTCDKEANASTGAAEYWWNRTRIR